MRRRRPKGQGHRDAEKVLRLERRFCRRSRFSDMDKCSTLSVFVDESGNLPLTGDVSRFYIVSFVVHDQRKRIDANVRMLDDALSKLGLPDHCFHAGPLIRREDCYAHMDWELRCRIFSAMMAFARRTDFRYRSVCVDKRFASHVPRTHDHSTHRPPTWA